MLDVDNVAYQTPSGDLLEDEAALRSRPGNRE